MRPLSSIAAAIGALAAILILACPPLQARVRPGTYEGNGMTIDIEKIDSAWRIECAHEEPGKTRHYGYWDMRPFAGQVHAMGYDYECAPEREYAQPLYRINIKGPEDLRCSLIGETVAPDNEYTTWTVSRDFAYCRMSQSRDGSLEIDMPDCAVRGNEGAADCGKLMGKYRRIKK